MSGLPTRATRPSLRRIPTLCSSGASTGEAFPNDYYCRTGAVLVLLQGTGGLTDVWLYRLMLALFTVSERMLLDLLVFWCAHLPPIDSANTEDQ